VKRPKREVSISVHGFKRLLELKLIRPASLDDVQGTHHKRDLYRHPNTRAWYVAYYEFERAH
jgi:hypothetical protein